jgi:hypothetical protein
MGKAGMSCLFLILGVIIGRAIGDLVLYWFRKHRLTGQRRCTRLRVSTERENDV